MKRNSLAACAGPSPAPRLPALVTGAEFDPCDTRPLLTGAFQMPEPRELAWAFYREHFDTLAGRVRSDEWGWLIGPVGNRQGVQTFLRAPPTVPGPGPTR